MPLPNSEFPLLTPTEYDPEFGNRFASHLQLFLRINRDSNQFSLAVSLFNALSYTLSSMVRAHVPYQLLEKKKVALRHIYAGLHTMTEDLGRWLQN